MIIYELLAVVNLVVIVEVLELHVARTGDEIAGSNLALGRIFLSFGILIITAIGIFLDYEFA